MKKSLLVSLALTATLVFAACAGGAVTPAAPPEAPAPAPAAEAPPAPPEPAQEPEPQPEPAADLSPLTLATTTSTYDSGLLDFILPVFTAETGIEMTVISVGTGAAMQLARDGEADVLLVHDRIAEDRFVDEGYAERRYDVMYNDFIIIGPADSMISHNNDIMATFTTILENDLPFVSRGDNSGTHARELLIWDALDLVPEDNAEYLSVGQGMGATISMTVELNAHTLSDRATWLNFGDVGDLVILCEGDTLLLNPYGIMVVSSTEVPYEANMFVQWMRSPAIQDLIASFGIAEFGESLFFPDAN